MRRKAAIELSVSTIVIVVLAMSMLILGLVLIKNIFTGTTATVDVLQSKVQNAIASLFTDDSDDVIVNLGKDRTATVRPDSSLTIGLGARNPDGARINARDQLQYKLSLEEATGSNCISANKLGVAKTKALFETRLDQFLQFDALKDFSVALANIDVNVPKGTASCTQKVFVDVQDKASGDIIGATSFKLEILKGGLF
ncbi:hypothetical protein KW805_04925 [Candidatus Pacearchaeota archaeon]|nr:hypothetical protein [Candidatus Pacearchaeota archaeon]